MLGHFQSSMETVMNILERSNTQNRPLIKEKFDSDTPTPPPPPGVEMPALPC